MYDDTIIFKVKTSIYQNCLVSPCTGLIKPNSRQLITIIIYNEQEIKSNIKFLFKIIQFTDINPLNIWLTTPEKDIYNIKFIGVIPYNQDNDTVINESSINMPSIEMPINEPSINIPLTDMPINEPSINIPSTDIPINDTKMNEPSTDMPINDTVINEPSTDMPINDTKINESSTDMQINEPPMDNNEKNNSNMKYEKTLLKIFNKINKQKPMKEKKEIAIQYNIESIDYYKYMIYFLFFFVGFCIGVKLTMI
jgi:hypothetical protein